MAITKTFPAGYLKKIDILDVRCVDCEIVDYDDNSTIYLNIVFRDPADDKCYLLEKFYLGIGIYDDDPYEALTGKKKVKCTLVEKRPILVKKWFPVEERNDE